MDIEQRKAVISIEMDQLWNFEIRWKGDNHLKIAMMGALDFWKDYLKSEILKGSAISDSEICRKEENAYTEWQYNVVSKNEAISLYLEAFEKIQSRLTAIAGTDERSTYQVPNFIKNI